MIADYGIRCFTRRPPDPTITGQSATEKVVPESNKWRWVTFLHNGAGVVAVGEQQEISPADTGRGCQLMTGVLQPMLVPPGKALYWACSVAPQNVSVTITEIPEAMVSMLVRR